MNKKMKILFTASVVANILLLSIAGGMAYKNMSRHSWKEVRENLAPETRHMMGRVFQKNHSELKPVLTQARARKKSLIKILTAEKFDRKKFESEAKKLQKSQTKIRAAKILSMGELAAGLPLAEREKLSVLFEKSLRDRGGRGGKGRRGGAHHKPPKHEGGRGIDVPIPKHRPE